MSPDGKNVYVSSFGYVGGDGALGVLRRDVATGALREVSGASGCLTTDGTRGCTAYPRLRDDGGLAVSPDGQNVYVPTSFSGHSILVFTRNPATGLLSVPAEPAACLNRDGDEGCVKARGLVDPEVVNVAPDGRSVYAISRDGNSVARFSRDAETGALTQVADASACLSTGGRFGCRSGRGMRSADGLAVSPDGSSVYVGSQEGGVAVLVRDDATSGLSQRAGRAGCVSSSGREGCVKARGIGWTTSIAVSLDGRFVYLGDVRTNGVAIFARDAGTGALRQLRGRRGCVTQSGREGCAKARALAHVQDVAISGDGANLYATASDSDAVAVFKRAAGSGVLTQLPGRFGCVSGHRSPGCRRGRGVLRPGAMAVSPDSRHVYVISDGIVTLARAHHTLASMRRARGARP